MYVFFLLILSLLTACTVESPDTIREEGVSKTRSIVRVLKKVRTREELLDHVEEITYYLKELVLIMRESDVYYSNHPGEMAPPLSKEDQDLSDELRLQLNRLFRLDGCQEVIEKCQKDALS